ncbi:MAG: prepilin peptidase [Kyrpidia sp.]|nr:prepilin peptidase [Kyrpidia sp.]
MTTAEQPVISWITFIAAGVVGAVVGSFLNVVAHRLPRGESVVFPPSRCPRCGARIRARDLVPVLSWVLLRGRCRDCGEPIHWQYPVVEGITGLLWMGVAWRYGWSWETVLGLVFVSFLVVLSAIDLWEWILPDALTYPLAAVALLGRAWIGPEPWWWYAGGAALGAGVLLGLRWLSPLLFGKEGMGLGDVKLMIGLGGMTGISGAVLILFGASVSGLIGGLILMALKRLDTSGRLPFGPFLAFGGIAAYLFGSDLWVFYLSMAGWGNRQ